ncbi:MAG: hypothetical protein A3K19_11455 [Lentisphaerae bacterium RIFOXYB12_FULL_65_16]|nr:MAG: hypothetical protein A3K18_09715 [Lentisphaerae bacterium RIFOXYA12_64_32]OGV90194.1 MAG: hypothetical protein A3K19_11455 [Lentisphaerae bacterium RIFOXYB12_FULL_65_16]
MPERSDNTFLSPEDSANLLLDRLVDGGKPPLGIAVQALGRYPADPMLLALGAWAAIAAGQPTLALQYLKRLEKRFEPNTPELVAQAIALAQTGMWFQAHQVLGRLSHLTIPALLAEPPVPPGPLQLASWLKRIRQWQPPAPAAKAVRAPDKPTRLAAAAPVPLPAERALPAVAAGVPLRLVMPDPEALATCWNGPAASPADFLLRLDFAHLALQRGFDELLCLPSLRNVDSYWYQIETVRKVLKQFRGRVLLADEVGLGKTIEAGMVLKEYLLRKMVERVLVLTPASLVGQWHEEMASRFDLEFVTSYDPLLRRDAGAFWASPRIIASISAARREPHFGLVTGQAFDLVIVDEAQHLKNRRTQNWQLVDGLKKRFLLLLSATPVQNNLVELYNLLTLLKPGVFKTEKEFRAAYISRGNPRLPANREQLRDLMREVMIRNTRSLVDVRLPPRHAVSLPIEPLADEQAGYEELSGLLRASGPDAKTHHRLAFRHLLEAAGSSPMAAAVSLERFLTHTKDPAWPGLHKRYAGATDSGKTRALLGLLAKNPEEKKLVFIRFTETLKFLDRRLQDAGIGFARFDGSMSGPDKDAAIDRFRDQVPVLLCTESGGEGRNVQFCNTLINFDLPWNPQTIEQRIGRLHRIGQKRDVFVFNLFTRHTVEERILQILDEKINMFELVVGEVQSILGEMEEEGDFAHLVFDAWVATTAEHREQRFTELGEQLLQAKSDYQETKALDEALFGEEFEVV